MAKEYFWGATLSKDKKIFKWDPESDYLEDESDEDDDGIVHFLFLKQAVLGLEAKDGERNVIEVETVNFDGETVTQPLLSLRLGLNESTNLDIGLQPPVTFKLATGSGPVFLSGQHALDLQEDEEFGKDFKDMETYEMGDEDLEDEEEGEEDEEEEETPKKVSTKAKDKKKVAVKAVKKGKGDELDDDEEDEDEDEEEEEEEEEKQTGKGKKRPAPSAKGAAKKMSKPAFDDDDDDDDEEDDIDWKLAKVDKDGTSKRKITNGSIENGHADGLDDDDDDDEDDEDYKVHDVHDDDDEEEDTSGEEEDEDEAEEDDEEMALGDDDDDEDDDDEDDEDEEGMDDEDDAEEDEEEEESSPEKPAKKAKGKVNGTVKPKGTPKTQASKSKGKKEQKTYSMEDMKQDLIKSPSKPKKEDKFKNFVKSKFHISEAKKIQELWGWYKATQLK